MKGCGGEVGRLSLAGGVEVIKLRMLLLVELCTLGLMENKPYLSH